MKKNYQHLQTGLLTSQSKEMKKYLCIIAMLCLNSIIGIAQNDHMSRLSNVVTPTENVYYLLSSEPSEVKKSTDKGETWTVVFPQADGYGFDRLSFVDENIGFVTRHQGTHPLKYLHSIYKTVDGGQNWQLVPCENIEIGLGGYLYAPDENTLININRKGDFNKSTNGGITWNSHKIGGSGGNPDGWFSGDIGFVYLDTNRGFYQTTDGGVTWNKIEGLPEEMPTLKAFFVNGDACFAKDKNKLWKVTGKGAERVYTFENSSIHDLYFVDEQIGYVVRSEAISMYSYLVIVSKTTDGGKSWEDVICPFGRSVGDITFSSKNDGIIVGSGTYGGGICVTRDGGKNWNVVYKLKSDYLDVNNIKALINPANVQFLNFQGSSDALTHCYEYPKGSGKHTTFAQSLWMGGINEQTGELHLAAEQFMQGLDFNGGSDYQVGTLSTDGSLTLDNDAEAKYGRVWKVTKNDVNNHVINYSNADYVMPDCISTWPAVAPFVDVDKDGVYNPWNGDCPLIKGDQTLFFVINDKKTHTESLGLPLGVEVHCLAWGLNNPNDDILNNTIFLSYTIHNRSNNNYKDFYVGGWFDFDLGFAEDDYIGSDVENGSIIGYNGTGVDGNGGVGEYGSFPPAQSLTFLGGPLMPAIGKDRLASLCDEGVNGFNFGDGIADNERLGMSNFMYYSSNGDTTCGSPRKAADFYNYIQSKWLNGKQCVYGESTYQPGATSNIEARFMFPALTDPCNWGTNGVEPENKLWTEESAGRKPGDRRGIGSMGPIVFKAGTSISLDLALVTARSYDANIPSTSLLSSSISKLRETYSKSIDGFGDYWPTLDVTMLDDNSMLHIYPNPASDKISFKGIDEDCVCMIYDNSGKLCQRVDVEAGTSSITVGNLNKGFYIVEFRTSNNKAYRAKVMIK